MFARQAINAYAQVGVQTGVMSGSPHKLIAMLYDGARSAINAYLMCFTSRSNICIHMELQNPVLARNAQNTLVEGLFKGIRILD